MKSKRAGGGGATKRHHKDGGGRHGGGRQAVVEPSYDGVAMEEDAHDEILEQDQETTDL